MLFATGSPDADEVFTLQPEPLTYTSPRKVATLTCAAKEADDIHVRCNREYLPDSSVTRTRKTINGVRILEVGFRLCYDGGYQADSPHLCGSQGCLQGVMKE